MPRKRVGFVNGKSWQDFAEMDTTAFNALSVDERKAVIDKMAHTVNLRLKRFLSRDEEPPAVRELVDSGGRISAYQKTEKQLTTEFARAKRFLNRETSSRKGVARWENNVMKSLREQGINLRTKKQFKEFWSIYNQISKNDPMFEDRKARYDIMEEIAREVRRTKKKLSPDEILQIAKRRLDTLYREQRDAQAEADEQAQEEG